MRVIIFSKVIKEKDLPFVQELLDTLFGANIEVAISTNIVDDLEAKLKINGPYDRFRGYSDLKHKKADFLFSLGGDGTILEATTIVKETGTPIIGVNLGRMGFLASLDKKLIGTAVDALIKGQYSIDKRTMLYMESSPDLFADHPYALNDCTLLKRDTSSMIIIRTYINGEYLNAYWADGLIISTPTGSTGYSLSCGGPIIFPNSGNFVITPVAPHNLNVRPIVIPDSSVITFEVEGRADSFLCTLDSRFETITPDYQLAVKKCPFPINLVRLFDRNFLQTIREKLTWGNDLRNYSTVK